MRNNTAGILTVLFYAVLREKDAERMLRELQAREGFLTTCDSLRTDSHESISYLYASRGMILTLSRFNESPWGLYVFLKPALVLESDSELYEPDAGSYRKLETAANHMLSKVKSPYHLKEMKLSRVAIALDLELPKQWKAVSYLNIIRQGMLPRHYRKLPFRENELHTASGLVNEHAVRQNCKTMTFTACDSVAIRGMSNEFPSPTTKNRVLRLQINMRRKAIRNKLKPKVPKSHYKALVRLSAQAGEIISQQLGRMRVLNGYHLGYSDAVTVVSQVEDGKTRKRMLYLLEEMRACGELTEAVEKLARKFSLSKRKVNRLFRKFHRLNISPVILPKTAKTKLPGLETLLTEPN